MSSQAQIETGSERLAKFIAEMSLARVPQGFVEVARSAIAHVLSAALAGSTAPSASAAYGALVREDSTSEASLLGSDLRMPASYAAFVNAVSACSAGATGSDTVVVIAALASAERENAPADRLELAVGLGLEVAARVAEALGPSHVRRGYDLAGTAGRVGAASGVAVVLELSAQGTLASLGYAATSASGLDTPGTPEIAHFVCGLAAADAVEAGLLASVGLIGPRAPLDGRRGLLALESGSSVGEKLVEGLGSIWKMGLADSLGDVHSDHTSVDRRSVAGLIEAAQRGAKHHFA